MNSFLKTGITSALIFMCGSAVAAKIPLSPSNKVNNQIAETRIVCLLYTSDAADE